MFKKRESPYSILIFAVTSKVSSNVPEEFYHFHHPKKIMFTVAHACFLKIGSADRVMLVDLKDAYQGL